MRKLLLNRSKDLKVWASSALVHVDPAPLEDVDQKEKNIISIFGSKIILSISVQFCANGTQ